MSGIIKFFKKALHDRKGRELPFQEDKAIFALVQEIARVFPSVLLDIVLAYVPNSIEGQYIQSLSKSYGTEIILDTPTSLCISGDYLAIVELSVHRIQLWQFKNDQWVFRYHIGGKRANAVGHFFYPTDVIIHTPPHNSHNPELIVCDSWNQRIQVFNMNDGKFNRMWSQSKAKPGRLNIPGSITILGEEIYIYERASYRISVFNVRTGKYLRSWGSKGHRHNEFASSDVGIPGENYMYVSKGELFITDEYNHRVQVFDPKNGNFLREFGTYGYDDGLLSEPVGIIVIDNEVYISEWGNHRISVFSREGKYIRKFGSFGEQDNQFNCPSGMAVMSGELAVADMNNNRMQIFR